MSLEQQVQAVVTAHRRALAAQVALRREELLTDDTSHHFAYRVLGVPEPECPSIDLYQNIGRFVYKYAGAMLEEATRILLGAAGDGAPAPIPNTVAPKPVQFHIDCLTTKDGKAHEIKWRDATTDGDHITKERNKIQSIQDAGYVPVRVMYFMPVRKQARKIQEKILATFAEVGEAYVGDDAWDYVERYSGVDLRELLAGFDAPEDGWATPVSR